MNRFKLSTRVALASLIPVLGPVWIMGVGASQRPLYQPIGTEAEISGIVNFVGEPPTKKRIDMGQDPVCAALTSRPETLDFILEGGGLANVFVYLKGGVIDSYAFPVPSTEVALAHSGCQLSPRVLGVQTGQTVGFYNLDPTTHNTHPTPSKNVEWNQSQAPGAVPLLKQFSRTEVLIPVRCNQHPWEKAYVGVLDHPFFSVSAPGGSFKISGVPPGDYELIAWHERFGERRVKIIVHPSETLTQDVTFRPVSD